MDESRVPNVYVIAGPNGAGKTTLAREFLPHYAGCVEFVNADLIAAGLSPFAPERAAFRAGRLMLEQIRKLARERVDFAFETTLSGRTYSSLLQEFREFGYAVHLFFLWIPTVEMSLARVADRVLQGGHNIPEDDIRRRFDRGLRNLFDYYRPLLDSWTILDNSTRVPRAVVREIAGNLEVLDADTYQRLTHEMEGA